MTLLRGLIRNEGLTMLLVTHDMSVARYADRVVHLLDGCIQRIEQIEPEAEAVILANGVLN